MEYDLNEYFVLLMYVFLWFKIYLSIWYTICTDGGVGVNPW